MSIFKRKKEDSIIFLFDIGSASVGGSIVKKTKTGIPIIIYSIRKEISLKRDIDSASFLEATNKALKDVTHRLSSDGFRHLNFSGNRKLPREGHCFLSSPWAVSETKVIKFQKKDAVFSKVIEESIVGREEDSFEKEVLSHYQTVVRKDARLIEKKIVDRKINGYSTPNPYGRKFNEIEISLYLSMAGEEPVQTFAETIHSGMGPDLKLKFHSFSLAASEVILKNWGPDTFNIVDVTGEITDIISVKDRIISESISFPIARNHLVKKITKKLGTIKEEAVSNLKIYQQDHLDQSHRIKIEEAAEEYGQDFKNTLNAVSDEPFSGKVYLIGENLTLSFYEKWLSSIDGTRVVPLRGDILKNKIKNHALTDPFMDIESLYAVGHSLNLQ